MDFLKPIAASFIALSLCFNASIKAQEDNLAKITFNGYVKNLHSIFHIKVLDDYLTDNLIHNRLNFKWYLSDHWNLSAELRNRLFYGDIIKRTAGYKNLVERANNDFFDWSFHIIDSKGWLLNSTIDRGYIEYSRDKWEIRAGRQRVNWGISTIWNPNDVFNAFSFTDFDYEERPGSDAIRIRYFTGVASSVEIAAGMADHFEDWTGAILWKWNKWNYDFQLLTGYVRDDWAVGGGWAGNLKTAGFKGEWTLFLPSVDSLSSSLTFTLGIDYLFSNSLYFSAGYLYNSIGRTEGSLSDLFNFDISAKNLYPFRHALVVTGNYPVTPLLSGGLTWIYSPVSSHPMFINPVMTYSVATNWDLDLVGQLAFNKEGVQYTSPVWAAFMRIKLSF